MGNEREAGVGRELMPILYVTDFGPFPALEDDSYTAALAALPKALPRPKSIVVMSGHWEEAGEIGVSAAGRPGIVHDYAGFPASFYRLDYPCAGNPLLAEEIVKLLNDSGMPAKAHPKRPLDHGAWVPLSRIYPAADIPVVQLSVPHNIPAKTLQTGRILSVLREQQILLMASGALSHNLRLIFNHQKNDPPDGWVLEFDRWIEARLNEDSPENLLNYHQAPHANLAAPTPDHFDPIFFVLGAKKPGEKLIHTHRSIRHASGIMRIFITAISPSR